MSWRKVWDFILSIVKVLYWLKLKFEIMVS